MNTTSSVKREKSWRSYLFPEGKVTRMVLPSIFLAGPYGFLCSPYCCEIVITAIVIVLLVATRVRHPHELIVTQRTSRDPSWIHLTQKANNWPLHSYKVSGCTYLTRRSVFRAHARMRGCLKVLELTHFQKSQTSEFHFNPSSDWKLLIPTTITPTHTHFVVGMNQWCCDMCFLLD